MQRNWSRGPLTSFRISLNEIDSTGEEGNDLMELVQDFNATPETQEMLLDDFVQVRVRLRVRLRLRLRVS